MSEHEQHTLPEESPPEEVPEVGDVPEGPEGPMEEESVLIRAGELDI